MPIAAATVELLQDGSIVATTTTNRAGKYQFTEVGSGVFTVKIIPPTGTVGHIATTTKTVDITRGEIANEPLVADFIFGLDIGGPGGPWQNFQVDGQLPQPGIGGPGGGSGPSGPNGRS